VKSPELREPRPDQVARPTARSTDNIQSNAWRRSAADVLSVLAGTGMPFFCDDVLMLVGAPPISKQLGSAFAAAQRQKTIQPAGAVIGHGRRLLRVWRGVR
jgi:hypothetical protein